MPNTLQDFLSDAMTRAVTDLEAAFLRLPEDKRGWSAGGEARSALDMMAECAILNDQTSIIRERAFPTDFSMAAYGREKADLSRDWEAVRSRLHESTSRMAAAIRTVSDEDLATEVAMPWGPMPMADVLAYPYWNMKYHEGQINFIVSLLGGLG